jgi:hypothetical protein
MLIDNQSVVANVTLPSSCFKKKHNSIAYHRVREAIAAKVIVIAHVCGTENIAEIATKVLGAAVVWYLLSNLLYGRNALDFSPQGELQRNMLTAPVLVDLGMYINLSGTNNQTSPNKSETHTTMIRTASLDIKGKNNRYLRGKKNNLLCKGR